MSYAFPMGYHPDGNSADQCGGLTKREWFAGMALQGLLSVDSSEFPDPELYAARALAYADAALELEDLIAE